MCHHWCYGAQMRLSVRLDDDVYTVALALAHSERISIAEAINRLVRRGVQGRSLNARATHQRTRSRFPTSAGKRLITSRDVAQIDAAEDEQADGPDQ
jgi:hypothetical protein